MKNVTAEITIEVTKFGHTEFGNEKSREILKTNYYWADTYNEEDDTYTPHCYKSLAELEQVIRDTIDSVNWQ